MFPESQEDVALSTDPPLPSKRQAVDFALISWLTIVNAFTIRARQRGLPVLSARTAAVGAPLALIPKLALFLYWGACAAAS